MEWGKAFRGVLLEDEQPAAPPPVDVPVAPSSDEGRRIEAAPDVSEGVATSLKFICDHNPTLRQLLMTRDAIAEDVPDSALALKLAIKALASQGATSSNLTNAIQAGLSQVQQDQAQSAKAIDTLVGAIEAARREIVDIDQKITSLQNMRQQNVDGMEKNKNEIEKRRTQISAVATTVTSQLQDILNQIK